MYELFKEVFEAMPYVQRIWVNQAGEYWLHPKHGCDVVEREKEPVAETSDNTEQAAKPKKDKKK